MGEICACTVQKSRLQWAHDDTRIKTVKSLDFQSNNMTVQHEIKNSFSLCSLSFVDNPENAQECKRCTETEKYRFLKVSADCLAMYEIESERKITTTHEVQMVLDLFSTSKNDAALEDESTSTSSIHFRVKTVTSSLKTRDYSKKSLYMTFDDNKIIMGGKSFSFPPSKKQTKRK